MSRPNIELKEENEKRLLSEIKAKKTILTALPPRCTFEISWRCNFNCKKCAYSSLERGTEFSAAELPEWEWDDISRIADEFFPTARFTLSTLLGEPFLSPQFKRLMDLHRLYGVYYRPTTNGSLLTESKLETINGVVDWLKCSFDGYTEELYQKLHLNKNFKVVVKNLKRFSDARSRMKPYPWFCVGLVLMRSNLDCLREYADFVFGEIGVDDIEIMSLNYANEAMVDESYWDIPDQVNRRIDQLVDYCIQKKYRLRLPFTRMPRMDGTWNGPTGHERACEIASTQPDADNAGYEDYSDDVRRGDIFGNKQALEKGYIWSPEMRVTRIMADDGSMIGICPSFNRPFFKPPTVECDGRPWIKVESCGSCSSFVFGNLKQQSFSEIYNSPMYREVRSFLYNRYNITRDQWMVPCKNCLCTDPVYKYESNWRPNTGARFFPGADLYKTPCPETGKHNLIATAWTHWREKGLVATAKATFRFVRNYSRES